MNVGVVSCLSVIKRQFCRELISGEHVVVRCPESRSARGRLLLCTSTIHTPYLVSFNIERLSSGAWEGVIEGDSEVHNIQINHMHSLIQGH